MATQLNSVKRNFYFFSVHLLPSFFLLTKSLEITILVAQIIIMIKNKIKSHETSQSFLRTCVGMSPKLNFADVSYI